MTISDWIDLGVGFVLLLTLVAVIYYAKQTKKQAEASRQMAEEMREQRMTSLQPILAPSLLFVKTVYDPTPPVRTEAVATVHNCGNGPAFVFEVFVVDVGVERQALIDSVHKPEFPYGRRVVSSERQMLVPSKDITFDFGPDDWLLSKDYLLAVEYGDIYKRRFRSGFICRASMVAVGAPLKVVNARIIPPALLNDKRK